LRDYIRLGVLLGKEKESRMKRTVTVKVVADALATAGLLLALAPASSCSRAASSPEAQEQTSSPVVSTAALQLKVLTASCGASQMQDFFQIVNTGTSPVKLSDIKIKFWADDTSGQALVPHIATGGCVSGPNNSPNCVHQAAGVTTSAAAFSPACGPDANHQANWEITISSTDASTLPVGGVWNNIQSAVNLANFSNFTPGTGKWFSACLAGSSYAADPHFAVYYQNALVFSNGIAAPDCRAPHGSQPLTTAYVRPPTSPVVGPVPANKPITLSIDLPVRNMGALQAAIAQASNPSSPQYRHYLSAADLKANHNPTDADYAALVGWAQGRGFGVVTSAKNLGIDVTGTAAQIEAAFHANLVFALRPDGTQFYELDRQPSIDLGVTLVGVSGLDNYVVRKPHAGTAPIPGLYRSSDLRTAYLGGAASFCSSLDGAGQSVGLFQLTGFNQADIDMYKQVNSLTATPPLKVLTANDPNNLTPAAAPPLPATGNLENLEISLDIEMVMAIAPKAQVVVFEGLQEESVLRVMADHDEVNQISSSWDITGSPAAKGILGYLASQGHTFFLASGDAGSYEPATATCPPADLAKIANRQAGPVDAPPTDARSSPYVTVVGGTALETDDATQAYLRERVWPGSGGGVLTGTPIPDFQVGATSINPEVSTVSRNLPDVAMPAQSVYIVASECNGVFPAGATGATDRNGNIVPPCPGPIVQKRELAGGGTSAAAPLWAGFTALMNQKGNAVGLAPVGNINAAIYQIGESAGRYANGFHDVALGANPAGVGAAANSCEFSYTPKQGYDLTTGWGSPRCGLVLEINGLDPTINVGISGTEQGGPMVCVSGKNFTPQGTVTVDYAGLPQTGLVRTIRSLPVAGDGGIAITDNQVTSVADALASAPSPCTPDQIANGQVIVGVTDDATGVRVTESVPASFWCQINPNAIFNVGCNVGAVRIRYSQYAACSFVPNANGGGGTTAPPNGAYVVFQLDAINNQLGLTPFPFDQSKLFVVDPHTGLKDFVSPNLAIYPAIFGPFAAQSQSVPSFTNLPFSTPADLALVVTTTTPAPAVEANQTAYTLAYDQQTGDPPVTMIKLNPAQTTFPAGNVDCNLIGLTKGP
jgi:hypothetical protein